MNLAELLLILLVALMVIKPERLPEVAKNIGIGLKWFRRVSANLRNELENAGRSLSKQDSNKNEIP